MPLMLILEACGAWPAGGGQRGRWSEFSCQKHKPNAARSEYFVLHDEGKGERTVPRVVVSRVWKTGSTALGQVTLSPRQRAHP